jgi:hypothetical protein
MGITLIRYSAILHLLLLWAKTKKADTAEHPKVFDHVGLLVNKPSSYSGVPFVKSSNNELISAFMVHLETDKTRGFLVSLHFVICPGIARAWESGRALM